MREDWFNWALVGGALGAAIGLLRDRHQVLGAMQRVATVVLSMLTPIIALGLGFFLLSLLFTGLAPLWETNQTTPILLSCALVAFFFANATIGNAPEEEPSSRILRYGAIVLAIVIVPLAAVALTSTTIRIDQHGFTPDRLWAATCILVALVFGLAYWLALGRARTAWPDRVRTTNMWLALGLCGLGVLLATPIVNFGAISTNDQVRRLTSGQLSPDQFDWRALAFDFGPSGRRALVRLKQAGRSEDIRTAAAEALAYQSKWEAPEPEGRAERRARVAQARVLPRPVPLPPALAALIERNGHCSAEQPCTILYEAGAGSAIVIAEPTCVAAEAGSASPSGRRECAASTTPLYRSGDQWVSQVEFVVRRRMQPQDGMASRVQQGWHQGSIEVRPVTRHQVFIGGEPVGDPFD